MITTYIITMRILAYLLIIFTIIQCIPAKNIVFIISDDMNVKWFEDPLVTPYLYEISKKPGVVSFINAYSNGCFCSPSRTSALTGKYPSVTGITNNEQKDGNTKEIKF